MTITDRAGNVVSAASPASTTDPNPGLAVKAPVRACTTAAITLSGLQTIDGQALSEGDRVLVNNQADSTTNGIYAASSGNWTRTTDADGNSDFVDGLLVFVGGGLANGRSLFRLSTDGAVTLGTTAMSWSAVLKTLPSLADFGAVGDGVTDDTTAVQEMLDSSELDIYLSPGTYKVADLTLSKAKRIWGVRHATILQSVATGHALTVATGLTGVAFAGFTLQRSGGASSTQDGLHFTGLTERALLARLDVAGFYNNFRLGATSLSECVDCFSNNAYNDGYRATNEDGVATGIQWWMRNNFAQYSDACGFRFHSSFGAAGEVAEHRGLWDYASTLNGLRYEGSSGSPIEGIRVVGGFFGSEGDDAVYVDSYGTVDFLFDGVYTEATGQSGTGVNGATGASGKGHGFNFTANNTDGTVTGCHAITHSYSGIQTSSPRIVITGCSCRLNGAAGVVGDEAGISVQAGNARIDGNSSRGQVYGIALANDNHSITNNELDENSGAPISASVTLLNSYLDGNTPLNAARVAPAYAQPYGDVSVTISNYDWTVYTTTTFTAARTWTLPAANAVPKNKQIKISDWKGAINGSNTLTIAAAGSDKISGASSITLTAAYQEAVLVSDGVSNWFLASLVVAGLSASGAVSAASLSATGAIQSSGGGVGYASGAGGAVTQATDKGTGVTLNELSGQVTMNNAALAAATSVEFTLSNSQIAATDLVIANIASGATANSYQVCVTAVAAGSCNIQIRNISAGSLSEALVINFAVIKAVAA